MTDVYDAVWPEGLTRTLWNYAALQPEMDRTIPFMGIVVDNWFLFYFFLGALVIAAFAFQRFNERFTEEGQEEWRVLRKLTPRALRGRAPIRRAYAYYLSIILVVYVALTFFGGIIAEVFSAFAVAGVQIETGNLNFENHAWPIALSAAFAGLAPMLPPLAALELRLRRWAHRTVGIPVRVIQKTNRILERLDKEWEQVRPASSARDEKTSVQGGPGADEEIDVMPWVRTHLRTKARFNEFLQTRSQLIILLDAHGTRGPRWPRHSVLRDLKGLEDELIDEAKITLHELDKLITAPFEDPSMGRTPRAWPSSAGQTDRRKLQRHQQELKESLDKHHDAIIRLRGELAAVLAVYGERDPKFHRIAENEKDPSLSKLKEILEEVFPPPDHDGNPQMWMSVMLIPVFLLLVAATYGNWNPMMGSVDRTALTIGMTGLLETVRVAILFLLPVAVAFSFRFHRIDRGGENGWLYLRPSNMERRHYQQLLVCVGLSLGVTVVALAIFAVVRSALLARDAEEFVEILLTRSYVLYYVLTQLFMSGIFVTVVLFSADAERTNEKQENAQDEIGQAQIQALPRHIRVGRYARVAAVLVVAVYAAHYVIYRLARGWGWPSCPRERGSFFEALTSPDCISYFGLVPVTIYAVLAFLAAGTFITSPRIKPAGAAQAPVAASGKSATASLAALVLLFAFAGSAASQGALERGEVVLGMRADAEPFSYRIRVQNHDLTAIGAFEGAPAGASVGTQGGGLHLAEASERGRIGASNGDYRYRGYIADLCAWIFSEGPYRVRMLPVEADDRQVRLRKPDWLPQDSTALAQAQQARGADKEPVDVLCDPLTLRYHAEDPAKRPYALYSPLIFVSGVSYLHRRSDFRATDVLLAYVETTTAAEVAERACAINRFEVGSGSANTAMCREEIVVDGGNTPVSCRPVLTEEAFARANEEKRYYRCAFPDHGSLIEWFCRDAPDGEVALERVYFGDIDIIRAKLRAERRRGQECRDVRNAQQTFTYEPYALAVTAADPQLFQFVQQRVYEFFSHRGDPLGEFTEYFDERMSQPLAWLFLLNAVDHPHNFERADDEDDDQVPPADQQTGSAGLETTRLIMQP